MRSLKKNGCKFWDAQADKGTGFIGYNYGLLANFPQGGSKSSIDQLEPRVISKLVSGEYSRNMTCLLMKPGEETRQEACTASIQFSVINENGNDVLHVTVNQRSSDVILGLPHDVCCWSIILHLVRREVFRRCGRRLAAGRVFFIIAAGGAHVYEINKPTFQELLKRNPLPLVDPPELIVETDKDLFDIARNFENSMMRVKGYCSHHPGIKVGTSTLMIDSCLKFHYFNAVGMYTVSSSDDVACVLLPCSPSTCTALSTSLF